MTESPSPPQEQRPVRPVPQLVPSKQEPWAEDCLFEQRTVQLDDGGSSRRSDSTLVGPEFVPFAELPDRPLLRLRIAAALERLRAEAVALQPELPLTHPDSIYVQRLFDVEEEVRQHFLNEVPDGWRFSRRAILHYHEHINMLLKGTNEQVAFGRRLKSAQQTYVNFYGGSQAIADAHHAFYHQHKRRLLRLPVYDLQSPESDFVEGRETEEARRAVARSNRALAIGRGMREARRLREELASANAAPVDQRNVPEKRGRGRPRKDPVQKKKDALVKNRERYQKRRDPNAQRRGPYKKKYSPDTSLRPFDGKSTSSEDQPHSDQELALEEMSESSEQQ